MYVCSKKQKLSGKFTYQKTFIHNLKVNVFSVKTTAKFKQYTPKNNILLKLIPRMKLTFSTEKINDRHNYSTQYTTVILHLFPT